MTREIIHTDRAPKAIGPYSQAVKAGNTVYLSGQTAWDANKQLVGGNDLGKQTRQSLRNVRFGVEAAFEPLHQFGEAHPLTIAHWLHWLIGSLAH